MKLNSSFYGRDDVVQISRELLGKVLCMNLPGGTTRAIITETEAYAGVSDKASHAYGGRRTRRTEPMFDQGGIAYVYLCYGIHHLFNVVTGSVDTPHRGRCYSDQKRAARRCGLRGGGRERPYRLIAVR